MPRVRRIGKEQRQNAEQKGSDQYSFLDCQHLKGRELETAESPRRRGLNQPCLQFGSSQQPGRVQSKVNLALYGRETLNGRVNRGIHTAGIEVCVFWELSQCGS